MKFVSAILAFICVGILATEAIQVKAGSVPLTEKMFLSNTVLFAAMVLCNGVFDLLDWFKKNEKA